MQRKDVTQQKGLFGPWHEINYALDEQGRYILVPSPGWEPKEVANDLSWEPVREEIDRVRGQVISGAKSPLAFYMALNLMDVSLLARYVGLPGWRVRRHLRPDVFRKLKPKVMKRYSRLFGIDADELRKVPDTQSEP